MNMPTLDDRLTKLQKQLQGAGQEHLLSFWNQLTDGQKERLARDIADVDFNLMERLRRGKGVWDAGAIDYNGLSVPEVWSLDENKLQEITRDQAVEAGRKALREGKVACIVVAGGQGTRLGFDGPKGTFPIGPVSGKTLFEIHCAKIRVFEKRYRGPIPFLVMTSEMNDRDTRSYFEENSNFGLSEVVFFKQGTMPALDDDGKLFLAGKDRLFRSPDGHGGTIKAMARSGVLDSLLKRGFEHLFYFQVDNPLVKIAEPFFLGAHALTGSDYSLKVLRKTTPDEKLGVLAKQDGTHMIVEYSDLPDELREARDADGDLLYWAGSPAIHVFSLRFLQKIVQEDDTMPFHRAHKKIPHITADGTYVEPEGPNGTKFERFIFDAILYAENVLAVEGIREEEFAPVKNKTGVDSTVSSRDMMSELHWKWLASKGVAVPRDENGAPRHPCEIHPTFAMEREDIPDAVDERVATDKPVYLE